jgi:hypothetical protein
MKQIITALLLFTSALITAQKKNYIITITGDTVYGDIELRQKKFIVTSTNKQTKEWDALNVKIINAENFKGTIVVPCKLYLYTDNLYEMQLGYESLKEADTVMVLKEIYGTKKMNLYYGTDNMKTPYYFYKTPSDSVPVQLVVRYHLDGGLSFYLNNTIAYRGEKARMHIEENKGYVNQLKAVMSDCSGISNEMWELLHYRDYSIKSLIKKYNNCSH